MMLPSINFYVICTGPWLIQCETGFMPLSLNKVDLFIICLFYSFIV